MVLAAETVSSYQGARMASARRASSVVARKGGPGCSATRQSATRTARRITGSVQDPGSVSAREGTVDQTVQSVVHCQAARMGAAINHWSVSVMRAGLGYSATNPSVQRTVARSTAPASSPGSAGAGWGTRGTTARSAWHIQDV